MGAETKIYVEVEVVHREWRESYGVTPEDAIYNYCRTHPERLTGRYRYPHSETEEID